MVLTLRSGEMFKYLPPGESPFERRLAAAKDSMDRVQEYALGKLANSVADVRIEKDLEAVTKAGLMNDAGSAELIRVANVKFAARRVELARIREEAKRRHWQNREAARHAHPPKGLTAGGGGNGKKKR